MENQDVAESAGPKVDKVKLETMAVIKSIPWAKTCNDFPVLVRVTAPQPPSAGGGASRAGVDLAAVLDVSEGMAVENRLENMKRAMKLLIQQLGSHDRLCILSFNDKVQLLMELSEMSDENREKARALVDKLKASGGHDVGAAMQAASLILGQRGEKDKNSRDGRVIVLSDSDDNAVVPTETSGFGGASANEEPNKVITRHYVADKTSSGITSDDGGSPDPDEIKDALEQCIVRGSMPVAATGLQIILQTHEGVAISAIESGSHCASFSPQLRSSTIQIQELRAGEERNFVVYLTVPEGKEHLINVWGAYRKPTSTSLCDCEEITSSVQLDHSEIAIPRPKDSDSDGDSAYYPAEAPEFIWLRLTNGAPAMVEHRTDDRLHRLWELLNLRAQKKDEQRDNIILVKVLWEKCLRHWAAVSKSYLGFRSSPQVEPGSGNMPAIPQKKNGSLHGKVKITSTSRALPYIIAVVVLAMVVALALRLMWNGSSGGSSSLLQDISQHPGLPDIEKSLEASVLQEMEEVGIASILNGSSTENISHAMNRYLYMGLVHTLGIGSRCSSAFVQDENVSLLERKIARLEVDKEDLWVQMEALAGEEEVSKSNPDCAAGQENEEALERVSTRIAELERQLQNDKAFAESLLAEITNADDNLKACGQRVDMLEAKVREKEA